MEKISVVIIAKNEEKNISRCLESVAWADEIILLDNGSTDKTIEIAQKFGCKIYDGGEWHGFGIAKRRAVNYANFDWILSLDADEVVSGQLAEDIKLILINPTFNNFKIKRKSFYLSKLIKYSGWQRDYPLRLFNKNFAGFNEKKVHESVITTYPVGKIESQIFHYTYDDLNSHFQKMILYSDLSVEENKGKKVSKIGIIFRGFWKFINTYFLDKGILDSRQGFILSVMSSIGVMIKYLKIYENESE
ncbi:MAG: glycosyltransferase family 2 protein [Candidatus Kapabacteria bacterium]|nr:glycosyltransferase family 2 protein [Ignavibacteriota bacterium]MCW5884708.1 glycosyltransferase family 2 protein [Candidatus Kapabacteria bacterium]